MGMSEKGQIKIVLVIRQKGLNWLKRRKIKEKLHNPLVSSLRVKELSGYIRLLDILIIMGCFQNINNLACG